MAKPKTNLKSVSANHRRPARTNGDGGKAAATRARLLDAAAKVLADKGFTGTRLSDVGDVAGVQAPAIYYHFNNKEELAGEVFIAAYLGSTKTLERILSHHVNDDPLVRIAVAIDGHMRITARHSDYGRAAAHRMRGDVPAAVLEMCRPAERAYAAVWTKLFAAASAQGMLREDIDLKTAQSMVLGALNAISYAWKPTRMPSVDVVVSSAQQLLLSGISPEKRDWSSVEPAQVAWLAD
jgi:AcrR family transcriptional regulator